MSAPVERVPERPDQRVAGPADERAAAAEPGSVTFETLDADRFAAALPALGELLADAVDSGASVNFVRPFSVAEATAYWARRVAEVADGRIRPIVARVDGDIVGCALLVPSPNPNAPHRADVAKVLVHRRARRRGVGRGLMAAIDDAARADGRWLLLLDTTTGSAADRMYRRLGWVAFGEVPNHALTADGALSDTTWFYKDLRPAGGA